MKNQTLFSLKDKSKKLKCRLLQFLLGALRVKKTYFVCFSCFNDDDFAYKDMKQHTSLP